MEINKGIETKLIKWVSEYSYAKANGYKVGEKDVPSIVYEQVEKDIKTLISELTELFNKYREKAVKEVTVDIIEYGGEYKMDGDDIENIAENYLKENK